jgi:hypothetical protein
MYSVHENVNDLENFLKGLIFSLLKILADFLYFQKVYISGEHLKSKNMRHLDWRMSLQTFPVS